MQAQPYGNEWIPFSGGSGYSDQQYIRLGIWQEGLYRISYQDLQVSGVTLSTWASPSGLKMYNLGVEQFVHVVDSSGNGVFDQGDYLEFLGRPNDGAADRALYEAPGYQPNPYVSLYNDTAAYFLTYDPSGSSGLRMPLLSDTTYSSHPTVSYAIREEVRAFSNRYNIGPRDYNEIADNPFMEGEGYYTQLISKNAPFTVNFPVQKSLQSLAVPVIDVTLMGANANYHPYRLSGNSQVLIDTTVLGYVMSRHRFSLNNLPANGTYDLQFAPQNDTTFPGNLNYMQMAFARLRYARNFDFSGEVLPLKFNLPPQGLSTLLCNAVPSNSPRLFLSSGDTVYRSVTGIGAPSTLLAVLPLSGNEKTAFITDDTQLLTPAGGKVIITAVNPDPNPSRYGRFTDFTALPAEEGMLIVTHRTLWIGATAYAANRASTGRNVVLADVDELYDQYAYGVRKHALSIRRFCDQMIDAFTPAPEYLLLLGKSVVGYDSRSGGNHALNLVPTFGEPPSDQMFTSRLNSTDFKPELATGRVSARTDAQVLAYLDKIVAFDAEQNQNPAEWKKQVLHFGGGTDLGEQNLLAAKLDGYRQVIEDTLFGGFVHTFLKSSTDPIQINQTVFLEQLIDSGCAMMTFYAHASGTSFDISTDDPDSYRNKDRYPLLLAQSCFVGNVHTGGNSLNERFVLTADKGSIGFIAVPEKGLIQPLDDYSSRFHEIMFRDSYGTTVGKAMRQTISDIILPDFERRSVCMNMTLHGDPSLQLYSFDKADYAIEQSGLFTEPSELTTDVDSFNLKIAVSNFARNVSDSIYVLSSRTFPDGTKRDTIFRVPYITYRDTLSVTLPMEIRKASGLNKIEVTIDVYDEVDEVDNVNNNVSSFLFQINSTDINPVYPPEYAIVPDDTVVLTATTATLDAIPRDYRFEIDTAITFDSPARYFGVTQSTFGIVTWNVPVPVDSGRVYYWRVANDSINHPDTAVAARFRWRSSSFVHKPGVNGWSQAHWYQFGRSGLSNIELVDSLRRMEYINSNYSLVMTHQGARPSYEINGVNMDYGGCFFLPQIAIAVLDSIEFQKPWEADSCSMYYGNYNYYVCYNNDGCAFRTRADKYFLFNVNNQAGITSLINMINNVVPTGNYILSWTVFPVNFDTLTQVKAAFNALGITEYDSLRNQDKYMSFVKKGDPSTALFTKGVYPDSVLRLDYLLSRDWEKGIVSSTDIGPAVSWESLYWDYNSVESGTSADQIYLQVFGITPTGQEVLQLGPVFSPGGPTDISFIDAQQFPRIRLKAYTEDLALRSPPQISRWQVHYQPVPEGAVNGRFLSFYKDTLQEGDEWSLQVAFQNISPTPMDTLLVDAYVFDKDNVRRDVATFKTTRNLPPGDTIMVSVKGPTLGLSGANNLWLEVNPRENQPEQAHFNNYATVRFNVTRDITNPLLEVTFDGQHILNRDIVSARPHVHIRLKDENRFIALDDTSDFRVSLRTPSGTISYLNFEQSPGLFSDPLLLSWTPAALPSNSFSIDYKPILSEDGLYRLTVEAKDRTGNLSGENDYTVEFEVDNTSSVTEVINYPNPFSTSTRFVFTLTGSEVPDKLRIRIMTVSGKIVREITRDEIGPLRIGRNMTEFAWDGRDEFGDQLANGVYLYQVVMELDGKQLEKRETAADPFFRKGWGKMYLMR
ncbi:MAG: C25 family cysteine peptidase [Bacteroidota bacterium]